MAYKNPLQDRSYVSSLTPERMTELQQLQLLHAQQADECHECRSSCLPIKIVKRPELQISRCIVVF